ncbi:hypothetical protein SLE2022_396350 [Rubroshorea leprosula]
MQMISGSGLKKKESQEGAGDLRFEEEEGIKIYRDLGVDEEGIKSGSRGFMGRRRRTQFDLQASSIAGSKLSRFLETEPLETWK